MADQYKLSATLAGHSMDVRSLAASPTGSLFSSSRDSTARAWIATGGSSDMHVDGEARQAGWREGPVYKGEHEGFVNACAWVPGGEGGGWLLTAGQDKTIRVWPLPASLDDASPSTEPARPSHILLGHDANVCALHVSQDGKRVVSGSWDKTAKVWDTATWQLLHTLKGHEQSVWAVLALSSDSDPATADLTLTAAADNLIHLWQGDKVVKTFKGHTQAVRALARLDKGAGVGDLFASAGNDATIRIWSLTTGEAVHTLYGHDSFVYSLQPIPDALGGGLLSGGEDRTVRVWRAEDGECVQTITIPAVSVWTVAALANGDVAAGSSDGLIRVFTKDTGRQADAAELKKYEEDVAASVTAAPDIKDKDTRGEEALQQPGKKEGDVLMIKKPNGTIEAHMWSMASRTWTNVGTVTGAVGSSQKQLYAGEEYDYVFDVNISDSAPPLKLPYNTNQNPYEAAQKFCFANELPLEYMDEIVKFIEKNTGGVTLGGGGNEYVDPYTGASRYQAQPPSGAGGGGFTGDPFTGGGRAAPPPVKKGPALLPHKSYLSFNQANLPALRAKLGQLNDTLAADLASSDHALSADELHTLDTLVAGLTAAAAAPMGKAAALPGAQAALLGKLLEWPSDKVFPGLDLARLVYQTDVRKSTLAKVLSLIEGGSGKEGETNGMLGLRAVANGFLTAEGRTVLKEEGLEVLGALKRKGLVGLNKNGKVALATVVLNYSVVAVQHQLPSHTAVVALDLVANLLKDADGETVYRALVALGNFLLSPGVKEELPGAAVQRYKTLAKEAVRAHKAEERMGKVEAELA